MGIDSIPLSIRQSRVEDNLQGLPGQWWWPVSDDPLGTLHDRPQVVTLCGSTRFVDLFNHFRQYWTRQGAIVLSIEIVTTQQRSEDPQHVAYKNKHMLDLLHLHKIDMSDAIFVIDAEGYIGESTRKEIEYATEKGTPIMYYSNR